MKYGFIGGSLPAKGFAGNDCSQVEHHAVSGNKSMTPRITYQVSSSGSTSMTRC